MKKSRLILVLMVCLVAMIIPGINAEGTNQGWIQINSNVDGASVYFDNNYVGLTSNGQLVVTVYMAAPVNTFTIEKSGYTTATGVLTMPEAGATTASFVTLRPISVLATISPYGSMIVDSSPNGAKIYLDGVYRGTSPYTLDLMTPGSYTVEAVLNGYQTYTTMVHITGGSITNVYCTLKALESSPNSVYVSSNPSNAYVYLDTIYKGQTPLTINDLITGHHEIELNAPGYYSWKTTVNLRGDSSTSTVSGQMVSLAEPAVTNTASTTAAPTLLAPTQTPTKSGTSPAVVIIALGTLGLVAGILNNKKI